MAWVEYIDLLEASLSDAPTGGEVPVVTASVADAGQAEGQTGRDVEIWGVGCVVYVPAAPSAQGRCQALATMVGGAKIIVATRDTRAQAAVGELGPGDAAFCAPSSKAAIVCKADGSISILQQGQEADAFVSVEKDGAIVIGNRWGQIQIDENGIALMLASGESLSLAAGQVQATADAICLASGTVALGAAAAVPLSFAPASGVAKPAPHVFV